MRQIIGFLTSDFILAAQWDHIYTANYFLALMGLLAASLAACTSTRCHTAHLDESPGAQPSQEESKLLACSMGRAHARVAGPPVVAGPHACHASAFAPQPHELQQHLHGATESGPVC